MGAWLGISLLEWSFRNDADALETVCRRVYRGHQVDAGERATSLLIGAAGGATVQAVTADLRITFGHLTALEFLNTSSGYEAWEFNSGSDNEQGCRIIALGGGDLAIFTKA